MPRHGRKSGFGPEWWPEGEQWPPCPGQGTQEWSGFGRTMARRALLFFGLAMLIPVLIGVAIGLGLSSDDPGWVSVGGRAVLAAAGGAVILGTAAWLLLRTWRPVRHLITTAGKLADGDYTARVPVPRSGSLRSVTTSFNAMAEQLEAAREQRRRLLADVGHELRTPLTVIRGEIEAILDGVHPADPEQVRPLLDDVAVMERLLDDLRTLSQAEAGSLALHREATDLGDIITETTEALEREMERAGVTVELRLPPVRREHIVDPVRIREVIGNLLMNAIKAMPDGGDIRIELVESPAASIITVVDTGIGIPPDAQERVFERFHKGTGSTGTGLGLTISRDLVVAHGGTLTLVSSTPAGTTMRIALP